MTQWQPEYRPGPDQPPLSQWNQTGLPPWTGQPQQPQFQPYQPPPRQPSAARYVPPQHVRQPPRARQSHKGLAFFGCGGLGAVVVLIAILVGAHSASDTPPAGAGAAPAAAPVVKPVTVATFSGSGITNTPAFTVTATWRLDYSFDCSSFGESGNFIIMEDGSFGAMNVNVLAFTKSGTSYAYNDAGKHYLEVNSECAWNVKVIDEDS